MIRISLVVLCLLGLLFTWHPDSPEWPVFQGLALLLFAVTIIGWAMGRLELQWSWTLLPMLLIVAWPAMQLLTGGTVYRNATILELLRWSAYAAIFLLAFWLFRGRSEIYLLLRILIIYSLILAAVSTMEFFAGNGKVFWIFTTPTWNPASMGPFMNRDHYASFMALVLPMAILRAFDEPKRRLTYVLAAAAIYASVVAGTSRAGSLVVTMEVLLCLAFLTFRSSGRGSAWERHRLTLGTVFLVAALVAVVGWEPLLKRFEEQDPYKGRRELVISTTAMILEKPWTGHGLGTWVNVYPSHAVFDIGLFANAAHNDWLQWASDGGIPFALLFFALFCTSIYICWRVPWAIGVPAVFIHCTVDFPIEGGRYISAAVFLIFGAALGRHHAIMAKRTQN